jgi:hypothetical protein
VARDPAYASRLPARHEWDDLQWYERRSPDGPPTTPAETSA